VDLAREFSLISQKKELFGAGYPCTVWVYAKTIIHLGVGEEWEIFISPLPLRGSANILHYSPPPR